MAWLGKVSLGGFPDLAEAVTKLSESVKSIERNFDSALGFEETPEEPSGEEDQDTDIVVHPENIESSWDPSPAEQDTPSSEFLSESVSSNVASSKATVTKMEGSGSLEAGDTLPVSVKETHKDKANDRLEGESDSSMGGNLEGEDFEQLLQPNNEAEKRTIHEPHSELLLPTSSYATAPLESGIFHVPEEFHLENDSKRSQENTNEHEYVRDDNKQEIIETRTPDLTLDGLKDHDLGDLPKDHSHDSASTFEILVSSSKPHLANHEPDSVMKSAELDSEVNHVESNNKEQRLNSVAYSPNALDSITELEKVRKEMKLMESALQGAARLAQAKADEIAKLMNENELLRSTIEDLKKKSIEAENDALREEYHQCLSSLERKVYALTKERDTLRREQNKKSDVALLLKEKDEIISQVMAEGENLSKKQASQESTIRKLRAQIREFDEEKQRLNSKLQVEESKVENIKRDKAETEKLLQETIGKNQAELTAQKEFYFNALYAAKESETQAETRANNEAKVELENRLREAAEREALLVRTLEELRQTLTRSERQAFFREDMLRRDLDDLQKRYQASELRYSELVTQVPESTRPLLRQIEAMQETAARKAEAWAGVESNLTSRLEAAEAKATASEEKERLMNDRLSQTLSRVTILETQIACLRAEQTQLSRSLEKERQRASENRQEQLAVMEEVATHEGRAKQLEDELRDLRVKHKKDLQEVSLHKAHLEKDLEQERATREEIEKTSNIKTPTVEQDPKAVDAKQYGENGAGSLSSMNDSFFLQSSLGPSETALSDRTTAGGMISYFLKSMTPNAFESALHQKDGELASYISRLASLESIRDSLAEELVKMTAQCEKLQVEAALLPGIRAELEALRRRHSSALELMGEHDEELEELRADIIDLKEMYREQVDLLVNKMQVMNSSDNAA